MKYTEWRNEWRRYGYDLQILHEVIMAVGHLIMKRMGVAGAGLHMLEQTLVKEKDEIMNMMDM